MGPLFIWYLILTILNIINIVLFFSYLEVKNLVDMKLYVLIGGLIYWGYMAIIELKNNGGSLGEGLLSEERTAFITDTFFKFVFSFVIGEAIYIFLVSFSFVISLNNITNLYCSLLFPLACLLEIIIFKPRKRSQSPKRDMIICCIIFAIFFVVNLLFAGLTLKKLFAYYGILLGSIIIAYVLYDYIAFWKSSDKCTCEGYNPCVA